MSFITSLFTHYVGTPSREVQENLEASRISVQEVQARSPEVEELVAELKALRSKNNFAPRLNFHLANEYRNNV